MGFRFCRQYFDRIFLVRKPVENWKLDQKNFSSQSPDLVNEISKKKFFTRKEKFLVKNALHHFFGLRSFVRSFAWRDLNVWLFCIYFIRAARKKESWNYEVESCVYEMMFLSTFCRSRKLFSPYIGETQIIVVGLFFASVRIKKSEVIRIRSFFLLCLHSAAYQSTAIDSKFFEKSYKFLVWGFFLIDVSFRFLGKHLFDVYIFFFFLSLHSVFPVNETGMRPIKILHHSFLVYLRIKKFHQ